MDNKSRIRVAGLDIAAVNSGLCMIEASPRNGYPPLDFKVLYETPIRAEMAWFEARVAAAKLMAEKIRLHEIDLVVVEGYALRFGATNTSGYQHAELAALTKYFIMELDLPILIVPPTTMRSFVQVKPKQKKQAIMDYAYETWGFGSKLPRKGDRSNVTDAFVHAYIGACIYFARNGRLTESLKKYEKNVVYGKAIVKLGAKDEPSGEEEKGK